MTLHPSDYDWHPALIPGTVGQNDSGRWWFHCPECSTYIALDLFKIKLGENGQPTVLGQIVCNCARKFYFVAGRIRQR